MQTYRFAKWKEKEMKNKKKKFYCMYNDFHYFMGSFR